MSHTGISGSYIIDRSSENGQQVLQIILTLHFTSIRDILMLTNVQAVAICGQSLYLFTTAMKPIKNIFSSERKCLLRTPDWSSGLPIAIATYSAA
jgi:hypothetical protein